MLSFRRLDIEDKQTVQKYTLRSKRRNCDLTFANLYSWRFLYLPSTVVSCCSDFMLTGNSRICCL